jgi:hypothetical protein
VSDLLDSDSAADFLAGRLDVRRARVRTGGKAFSARLEVDATSTARRIASLEFLPLLCGGIVLDEAIPLETLDALLDRESGFLSGWRVLVGGEPEVDDPFFLSLVRAHARGVISVVPTDRADPEQRAAERAGLRLIASGGEVDGLHAVLRD